MYNDLNEYIKTKLIYTIIFANSNIDYKNQPELFNISIVKSLKNVIKSLTKEKYLSKKVKENIYKYVMEAREFNDEHKEERYNELNEIVKLVNGQKEDLSYIFYTYELYKRINDKKYLSKCIENLDADQIKNIHESIFGDLLVLTSHSNDISDDEFINEYLPNLTNSYLYYESINAILHENPSVFKDLTFYNRMICVFNVNNEIYKNTNIQKEHKKIVKSVKKSIK